MPLFTNPWKGCSYPGCRNNRRRKNNLLPAVDKITSHCFPSNEKRCKLWLEKAGMDGARFSWDKMVRGGRLCSDHFEDRFYFHFGPPKEYQRLRLHPEAYPTLFNGQVKIPQRCLVRGCSNIREHCNPKIVFFDFPTNTDLSELWRRNSGRVQPEVMNLSAAEARQYFTICSNHFEETQFSEGSDKKQLKPGAVPTIIPEQGYLPVRGTNVTKQDVKLNHPSFKQDQEWNSRPALAEFSGLPQDEKSSDQDEKSCDQDERSCDRELADNSSSEDDRLVDVTGLLPAEELELRTNFNENFSLNASNVTSSLGFEKEQMYQKQLLLLLKENAQLRQEIQDLKKQQLKESDLSRVKRKKAVKSSKHRDTSDPEAKWTKPPASYPGQNFSEISGFDKFGHGYEEEISVCGIVTQNETSEEFFPQQSDAGSNNDNEDFPSETDNQVESKAAFSVKINEPEGNSSHVDTFGIFFVCTTCQRSWSNADHLLDHLCDCVPAGKIVTEQQLELLREQLVEIQNDLSTDDSKLYKTQILVNFASEQEIQVNTIKPNSPVRKSFKRIRREFVCENCMFVFDDVDNFLEHAKLCFLQKDGGAMENLQLDFASLRQQLLNVKQSDTFVMKQSELIEVCRDEERLKAFSIKIVRSDFRAEPVLETNEPFICIYCSKMFTQKSSLLAHERNIHGERNFKCNLCGKVLANKHNLKIHKQNVHGTDCIHQCRFCGKLFKTKTALSNHEKREAGVVPKRKIKCELCKANFRTKSEFEKHMLTHFKDEKYKCSQCYRSFKSLFFLKTHEKSHYLRFKCNRCDREFNYKAHLSWHVKSAHGESTKLKCPSCKVDFASDRKLANHFKKKHLAETLSHARDDAEDYEYHVSNTDDLDTANILCYY